MNVKPLLDELLDYIAPKATTHYCTNCYLSDKEIAEIEMARELVKIFNKHFKIKE